MTVHRLKTLMPYYGAVVSGVKPFEVRRDDRSFRLGDILHLVEIADANGRAPTGREAEFEITYILPGGAFGVDPGFVVLGIADRRSK